MGTRTLAVLLVSGLALAACEQRDKGQPEAAPAASAPIARKAPAAEPSFVNKVWSVTESPTVATGSLRVFLSDGTLVMASLHDKPALGSWRFADGQLTLVEEGREYPTDILALSDKAFRIQMHGPGAPVRMLLEPAESASPAAVENARQTAAAAPAAAAPAAAPLWGTAWRLDSLAGKSPIEGAQVTLEFPSEGRASGRGSCNRFNGVVTVEGGTIRFGGLAATRMACAEALMRQEESYFDALHDSERYEVDGETLRIFSTDRPQPLSFTSMPATAPKAQAQIERAAPSSLSALNGIWTIVGHHAPGTSAITDEQARARYGESLRLTASAAVSAGRACREPRYATRQVAADAYLADEFKLAPGSLPPLAARDQVRIMEVSCGDTRWDALGATVLQLDRDHALAPRDGIFFELERDHDFRGLGQEPGWSLEIHQGEEIRFSYDYGKGLAVVPATPAQVDATTGTRSYRARHESADLRVEIVPVACTDSMSGQSYPTTVSVTLNGRAFRGCGQPLTTPYQG
jgi:heat shock protein HslJ